MTLLKKTHELTLERASKSLIYNPIDGSFRRLNGNVAGHITEAGYLRVRVDGKRHMAHRLAWLLYYGKWPERDIDHIDGDGLNNRIANLREADRSQNLMNAKLRVDNAIGLKGVHARKDRKTLAAVICIGGKQRTLGYFKTPELAHAAYCSAAHEHFGEFARAS